MLVPAVFTVLMKMNLCLWEMIIASVAALSERRTNMRRSQTAATVRVVVGSAERRLTSRLRQLLQQFFPALPGIVVRFSIGFAHIGIRRVARTHESMARTLVDHRLVFFSDSSFIHSPSSLESSRPPSRLCRRRSRKRGVTIFATASFRFFRTGAVENERSPDVICYLSSKRNDPACPPQQKPQTASVPLPAEIFSA